MIYNKIIFVCNDNTALSPLAARYMKEKLGSDYDIISRGVVVLYSEPYNPKVYDLLLEDGIVMDEGSTKKLSENDFSTDTLVFVMSSRQEKHIYDNYRNARNVYTINEFVTGVDADIDEPYGQGIDAYREVYKRIKNELDQIVLKLERKDV